MSTCQSAGLRILALVTFIFMLLTTNTYFVSGAHLRDSNNHRINPPQDVGKVELGMELFPTGSRLPDCSHACGACMPCKRVMVSFKCSVSESCPVVYRCMCRGKFYHVPSN